MLPVFRLLTDFHQLNCKHNHFLERRAQSQGDFLRGLFKNPDELLSSPPPASFWKIIQSKNVLSAIIVCFTYEKN